MTIQEISPTIKYRPGCKNVGPDALSRAPIEDDVYSRVTKAEDPCHAQARCQEEEESLDVCVLTRNQASHESQTDCSCGNQSNGEILSPSNPSSVLFVPPQLDNEGEEDVEYCPDTADIAKEQRSDPYLFEILEYIESGTLPKDARRARRIVLERRRFDVVDGLLCYCDKTPSCRIAVPKKLQAVLLAEAHNGRF